jgi:hypothetical protein
MVRVQSPWPAKGTRAPNPIQPKPPTFSVEDDLLYQLIGKIRATG